mmetsp:Transcript_76584/g.234490  ORF Transcript_76584/g.234490 Transcript_76584/m.234490 type:complete len:298 (-) Transcript_76584:93-986(-)
MLGAGRSVWRGHTRHRHRAQDRVHPGRAARRRCRQLALLEAFAGQPVAGLGLPDVLRVAQRHRPLHRRRDWCERQRLRQELHLFHADQGALLELRRRPGDPKRRLHPAGHRHDPLWSPRAAAPLVAETGLRRRGPLRDWRRAGDPEQHRLCPERRPGRPQLGRRDGLEDLRGYSRRPGEAGAVPIRDAASGQPQVATAACPPACSRRRGRRGEPLLQAAASSQTLFSSVAPLRGPVRVRFCSWSCGASPPLQSRSATAKRSARLSRCVRMRGGCSAWRSPCSRRVIRTACQCALFVA